MDRGDVDRWLAAYVEAWKSYEREAIAALFTDDVEYRYYPGDEPIRGREAVVATWLGEAEVRGVSSRDTEGTYDATYRAFAVDGELAVATGSSTYLTEPGGSVDKVYDNCFLLRFGPDGRCAEFTEFFMERKK